MRCIVTVFRFITLFTLFGWSGHSGAAMISVDLSPSAINAIGHYGLYLAYDSDDSTGSTPRFNWEFTGVTMSIDTVSGDATVSGSMQRLSDSSEWSIDIALTGANLISENNSVGYDPINTNLYNTLTANNDGNGMGWTQASMQVTASEAFWGPKDAKYTTSLWGGVSTNGEPVAELTFYEDRDGISGLFFDSLFSRIECSWCNYQHGDTSAYAQVNPVPLPATLPLLASALAGLGFVARRKSKRAGRLKCRN